MTDPEDMGGVTEVAESSLATYYQARAARLRKNAEELQALAQGLWDAVPPELDAWKKERFIFGNTESDPLLSFKNFIILLRDAIDVPGDGIDSGNLAEYGFTSLDDVVAKMELLKKAWAGNIGVRIVKTEEAVSVKFVAVLSFSSAEYLTIWDLSAIRGRIELLGEIPSHERLVTLMREALGLSLKLDDDGEISTVMDGVIARIRDEVGEIRLDGGRRRS